MILTWKTKSKKVKDGDQRQTQKGAQLQELGRENDRQRNKYNVQISYRGPTSTVEVIVEKEGDRDKEGNIWKFASPVQEG